MTGVDSSLRVAVSESRLLLEKIKKGNSGFKFDRDTFCNVLTNPYSYECVADVRLIAQTAESINVAATSHPDLGTPDEI
ncbi:hypothetical protein N7493_009809 [Penicillium malachiteum]|uniref:Uncharacterized protein n=1 Tax=Penicillium malachiteum TaxID=1324776 RepID=A0AAD6HDJ7_9EURO|nr:hypothetical protein N7493_009809 [Penicillium malachiteum]